jgi:hypothetical protein
MRIAAGQGSSFFTTSFLETKPLAGRRIDERHPTLGATTRRSTIDAINKLSVSPPRPPQQPSPTAKEITNDAPSTIDDYYDDVK